MTDPRQLTFWPEDPIERQDRKISALTESVDKNRKSLHAKHSSLAKMYCELKNDLDVLKAAICKNSGEFRF